MKIPSSIFKAYDIRGIVETELTHEIVKLIGRAVGSESIEKGERGVVVGRDGRQQAMVTSNPCDFSRAAMVTSNSRECST